MELKVTLDYQQILEIVRQLSANQVAKLLVDAKYILNQEKKNEDKSLFQKLLLSAPVMTDAQYDDFLDNRKKFNQDYLATEWLEIIRAKSVKKKEKWFNNALRKFAIKLLDYSDSLSTDEKKQTKRNLNNTINRSG